MPTRQRSDSRWGSTGQDKKPGQGHQQLHSLVEAWESNRSGYVLGFHVMLKRVQGMAVLSAHGHTAKDFDRLGLRSLGVCLHMMGCTCMLQATGTARHVML